MRKEVTLRDGSKVVIRPMKQNELDPSFALFQALAPEDRAYLRRDVTRREVLAQRIRAQRKGRVKRLVAVIDDRIVADATLELESPGWEEHVAEPRLIVAAPYRRKGLGRLMARELYSIASQAKTEEVIVRMMRPQVAARPMKGRSKP